MTLHCGSRQQPSRETGIAALESTRYPAYRQAGRIYHQNTLQSGTGYRIDPVFIPRIVKAGRYRYILYDPHIEAGDFSERADYPRVLSYFQRFYSLSLSATASFPL